MSKQLLTVQLDRTEELAMFERFEPGDVDKVLEEAAKEGAKAAAKVLKSSAPVGTAQRLGQYYRKMGWRHGTLRGSVRASAIRQRGGGIRGYVAGPIGKKAFTRHWVTLGTVRARAKPWIVQNALTAFQAAERASEAILARYAEQ